MARGRYDQFQTDVLLANNDWRVIVGKPYIDAYTVAFKSYGDTLQKQKDADKEAAQLFVTAACVATGSVLLGSIGSATLGILAKRTVAGIAMKTLNDNMFRLFRIIRKNEGVAFAVGSFVDGLKDKLREGADKLVEEYLRTAGGIISPEPVIQLNHFESFMAANVNCALRMALLVENDPKLSEAQKNDHFKQLRAAPFLNKPAGRSPPFKATMAEIIELTFYLSAMLETDFLEKKGPGSVDDWGRDSGTLNRTAITQSPLAPDYPKSTVPAPTYTNYHGAYQTVAVDRAGGQVQKRTNELSTKILGTPVYSSGLFGVMGPADTEKGTELETAARLLAYIAKKMKPLDPFEAIG